MLYIIGIFVCFSSLSSGDEEESIEGFLSILVISILWPIALGVFISKVYSYLNKQEQANAK